MQSSREEYNSYYLDNITDPARIKYFKTLFTKNDINKNDLLKFRNFGKKSLTELDELLESMSLSFGMDVSRYKLEKD